MIVADNCQPFGLVNLCNRPRAHRERYSLPFKLVTYWSMSQIACDTKVKDYGELFIMIGDHCVIFPIREASS